MSSERNFETLEAGTEYEARNGLRIKIVGEGADGWWLGYTVKAPREVNCWKSDGRFSHTATSIANLRSDGSAGGVDLIRKIEPKRVIWLNIEKSGLCHYYATRAEADHFMGHRRIACVRVEYVDGQFDS